MDMDIREQRMIRNLHYTTYADLKYKLSISKADGKGQKEPFSCNFLRSEHLYSILWDYHSCYHVIRSSLGPSQTIFSPSYQDQKQSQQRVNIIVCASHCQQLNKSHAGLCNHLLSALVHSCSCILILWGSLKILWADNRCAQTIRDPLKLINNEEWTLL